ncbi:MAG: thiamine phosphate synthase [Acidobacteriota bacterium]|nr:thiamine phosphate synthase [Acidobacteriota bacterium]
MPTFPELRVPRILLVTDSRRLVPDGSALQRIDALERQAREAFAAGVDAIQLREPGLSGADLLAAARALAALGPVIVNDRADIALASGASGVHLRADGPKPHRVRALVGPSLTLSRAVHSAADAAVWEADGPLDWLIAGTVFESASKPGRAPMGVDGLAAIVHASQVPVVAIGGITGANSHAVFDAGAAGIAAIALFLSPIRAEHVDRLRDRSLE